MQIISQIMDIRAESSQFHEMEELPPIKQYITEWRELRGMKSKDLAEGMDISNSYASDLENGKKQLNMKQLYKASKVLKCAPWQLLAGPPDNLPSNTDDKGADFADIESMAKALAYVFHKVAKDGDQDGTLPALIDSPGFGDEFDADKWNEIQGFFTGVYGLLAVDGIQPERLDQTIRRYASLTASSFGKKPPSSG